MAELEKVIKGMECCQLAYECKPYEKCPYSNGHECGDCDINRLHYDAVTLLKEQEAVKPRKKDDGNPQPWTSWWYVCGDCGQEIEYHDRYCRWCGRAVQWDG